MPPLLTDVWPKSGSSQSSATHAVSESTQSSPSIRASKRRRLHRQSDAKSVTSEATPDEPLQAPGIQHSLKKLSLSPLKQEHNVLIPPSIYPRSRYQEHVLNSTYDVASAGQSTIDLSDFSIYRPCRSASQQLGAHELISLEQLAVKAGHNEYLFDGTIDVNDVEHRLIRVKFDRVSVEGYGADDQQQVRVYIQSERVHQSIWFRLRSPSHEYYRYWVSFLWTAQFAKYFVDYADNLQEVNLHMMRKHFATDTQRQSQSQRVYRSWLASFGKTDFSQAFVRNAPFIFKEISSVSPSKRDLQIWKDVCLGDLQAIPSQLQSCDKTTVTPYVYNLFKACPFGSVLQPVSPSVEVTRARYVRLKALGFEWDGNNPETRLLQQLRPVVAGRTSLAIGNVIVIPRDSSISWEKTSFQWFAYVVGKKPGLYGDRHQLEVLWLYEPKDTILKKGMYPLTHELFLSDHCNCGLTHHLNEDDVTHTLDVDWGVNGQTSGRYFVRQRYLHENGDFSTLSRCNPLHLLCKHKVAKERIYDRVKRLYKIGDTILAAADGSDRLEPFVVTGFDEELRSVNARALLRINRLLATIGSANELAWTEVMVQLRPSRIRRSCNIRFCPRSEVVPIPYNRDGRGDCFYISLRLLSGSNDFVDIERPYPSKMRQGFAAAFKGSKKVLRGLSLFSGGGNFDLGLEDAGAIKTDYYVEWDRLAAHTLRANTTRSARVYCGSVDDYLRMCLEGKHGQNRLIARIGDVTFISAGSPCQGFSAMQQDKSSIKSLTNASKVASVLSFIDVYRPKYALLENVLGMAQQVNGISTLDQLLCAVVGMGYQVKSFNIVACTMGDPQHRSRLFVSISAPGLPQPQYPPITHLDDEVEIRGLSRSLGKTANGLRYGEPEIEDFAAPFPVPTASSATADLPIIDDGHVGACIAFPDHRPPMYLNERDRLIIQYTPRLPRGLGLASVSKRNDLPSTLDAYIASLPASRKSPSSSSWRRAHPDRPFATVITKPTPADYVAGGSLIHWEQHRVLTVMEARRAQGFHDDQVILGTASQQWKIIGNSVSRGVALALGLSLRRAYMGDV